MLGYRVAPNGGHEGDTSTSTVEKPSLGMLPPSVLAAVASIVGGTAAAAGAAAAAAAVDAADVVAAAGRPVPRPCWMWDGAARTPASVPQRLDAASPSAWTTQQPP